MRERRHVPWHWPHLLLLAALPAMATAALRLQWPAASALAGWLVVNVAVLGLAERWRPFRTDWQATPRHVRRDGTVWTLNVLTDAVAPAGCKPGRYHIGGVDVELHAGNRVTLVGQDRLAGSALRMDDAISNLMRRTGRSLTEAVTMATRNPARVGRIASRQRGFAPGERADVVEFHYDGGAIEVLRTWLDGERVYG